MLRQSGFICLKDRSKGSHTVWEHPNVTNNVILSGKLPVVSGAECIKVVRQRGSHIVLVKEQPKTTVIVPNHKELDKLI